MRRVHRAGEGRDKVSLFFVITSSLYVGYASAALLFGYPGSIWFYGTIAINILSIVSNARNLVDRP
jgi:hypothetical protein